MAVSGNLDGVVKSIVLETGISLTDEDTEKLRQLLFLLDDDGYKNFSYRETIDYLDDEEDLTMIYSCGYYKFRGKHVHISIKNTFYIALIIIINIVAIINASPGLTIGVTTTTLLSGYVSNPKLFSNIEMSNLCVYLKILQSKSLDFFSPEDISYKFTHNRDDKRCNNKSNDWVCDWINENGYDCDLGYDDILKSLESLRENGILARKTEDRTKKYKLII